LQQFFGIIQELVRLVGIHPQRSRCKLGRHGGLRDSGIGGHKAHFIDVNM
jgi:hypothetical protein